MTLDDLDDAQLGQVLQHLVAHFDDSGDLPVTEEEIAARTARDRRFLEELAQARGVSPDGSADPSLREVIETIAETLPETRPTIEEAAGRIRRVGTLPLADVALDVLLIAAAAAILRPKGSIHFKTKASELKVNMEAGGAKGLDAVLALIMEFVSRRQ
ncbi:hypothetical protein [Thermoactinospora rubra]|uniref:hypothetical protein n=1 Tax=Thermoactinospora rubra TaxID=1088767 RepID=UPI000A1056E5|nr:hypothetical protein [Thermoactinospora rubra]